MRLFVFFIVLLFFAPYTSTAAAKGQADELKKLDQKLQSGVAEQKALEKNLKTIEKELGKMKSSLVKTAKSIQANERDLQKLDIQITDLEKEQKSLIHKLQKERGSIANLILALERIRRVPPEALIVKPDAPFKTAQSAMLMQDILPLIHKQASDLKINLERLDALALDLQSKRERVVKSSETLETEQKALSVLVAKRTKLYESTHRDLGAQKKKIAKISSQAKNLADLVKKLDEERTRYAKKTNSTRKIANHKPPKAGEARLPLPGILKTAYNEPDNFGAPSQGIDIEGRAGALVVAPMGGIVQFAGFFKNYGNMIILEHEKGWHSLIAGLENIDTVVGQSVSAGEPLGVLHKSSSDQKPVLYYELRHKGKPVNPAKKFGKLS